MLPCCQILSTLRQRELSSTVLLCLAFGSLVLTCLLFFFLNAIYSFEIKDSYYHSILASANSKYAYFLWQHAYLIPFIAVKVSAYSNCERSPLWLHFLHTAKPKCEIIKSCVSKSFSRFIVYNLLFTLSLGDHCHILHFFTRLLIARQEVCWWVKCCHKAKRVLARVWQQTTQIMYKVCANLPVTSHWTLKMFENVILREKNYIELLWTVWSSSAAAT